MRRLAGWTLLFVFVLSLFGCGKTGGDMRVRGIDSEIYTDEDEKEQEYILSFGDYDEVIVLLSSFTVDEHGGDGSLEPNHTYTRWSWYLARRNGGKWKIVTSGYG